MKKSIKICLIIMMLLAIIAIVINIGMVINHKDNIYDENITQKYDMALVLGCKAYDDGKPSLMLRDRLNTSITLYNNGNVSKIIVSGAHREGYDEVDAMKNYLVSNGIPIEDIITDYKGVNTAASIKNYANNYKDKSLIIVSQKYHLYRALFLADRNNLNAIGVHAKLVNYFGQTYRDFREIVARCKDYFIK